MRFKATVLFGLLLVMLQPSFAKVRHYYIAAEDVPWDFAPSGWNLIEGGPLPRPWGGHTKWPKTRYIGYTDATFTVRTPQPEWLGILGPIIRAEVGDEIIVDFLNRSVYPHSIHPHGVLYDKENEGAYYVPAGRGSLVPTNSRFTYHWFADEHSGPAPGQPSSVVWWYHTHAGNAKDINSGLMGPIIITAKGKAKPDGSPKDVDREFVASFMIFDQLNTKPEGLFYAINGYIFGNLPGLVMKKGDHVRWYLLGMGNEIDMHTPHWHGETVTYDHQNVDLVELLPGSMKVVDMIAYNPGTWMFHCHVLEHMESGMMVTYTIYEPQTRPCPLQFTAGDFYGTSKKYSVTVKNLSDKPIKQLTLEFEHFIAPQYLHRPFDPRWTSSTAVPPGGSVTLEKDSYLKGGDSILGWALYPQQITYADGSVWNSAHEGECFQMYWRDKDHPNLEVLPPHQVEMNED
jgi:manganese oxidase